AAELAGLVAGEEDYAPRFLGISFKHCVSSCNWRESLYKFGKHTARIGVLLLLRSSPRFGEGFAFRDLARHPLVSSIGESHIQFFYLRFEEQNNSCNGMQAHIGAAG
ncbi:MAG TPA: hypothetical protein VGJ51_00925, partial [Candidatus Angelobacter sp.]